MLLSVEDQGDGGAETGFAGGFRRGDAVCTGDGGLLFAARHFGQELRDIGGRVALGPAIAGGMDAGTAAEDIDLEAGIVGKAVQAGLVIDVLGLLQRVGPEGISRLGDFFGNAHLGGRDEFETFAENGQCFVEFAGIVGGKDDLHKSQFLDTAQRYFIFS